MEKKVMRKVILFAGLGVVGSLLTGCGGQIGPAMICGPVPGNQTNCGIGGRVTWPMKSSGAMKTAFDAGLISVDMSTSNVPIDSNSGYVTITIDLDDGSTVANSFEWIRVSSQLVLSSPAALNAWVQPYLVDAVEIEAHLDVVTDQIPGNNVIVAEIDYNGSTQAGSSYSFYNNGGGCPLGSCLPY